MSRSILAVVAFMLLSVGGFWTSAVAADRAIPTPVGEANYRHIEPDCGRCGRLHVTYVYHRDLRQTYGIRFDPRNYDEIEPHYYFGPMRRYPRYYQELGD